MNAKYRIRLAAPSRQGFTILAAALLLLLGCSKSENGTGPEETTAAEDLAAGWTAFEANNYFGARTLFTSAIGKDATLADAHNGLGWCQAILNNLSPASTAFLTALTHDSSLIDAVAGLAFVYRDLPDLDQAILRGEAVLAANLNWQFSHMTSVNSLDIRVVIAQANFRKGEANFSDAQTQVDFLDPANGLDPGNSATWLVGGTLYNTYAEALLMKIEELAADEATP